MHMQASGLNYVAVAVGGIIIFVLGGLWYSPLLFAKKWVALMGKNEEEMRAAAAKSMASMYVSVFLCGMLTSWAMAVVIRAAGVTTCTEGALLGGICWLGFTGATTYGTNLFSLEPRGLWLINSGYNLVCIVIVGCLHALWH